MSLCYESLSVRLNLNLTGIKFPFVVRYWVYCGGAGLAECGAGYSAVGFALVWVLRRKDTWMTHGWKEIGEHKSSYSAQVSSQLYSCTMLWAVQSPGRPLLCFIYSPLWCHEEHSHSFIRKFKVICLKQTRYMFILHHLSFLTSSQCWCCFRINTANLCSLVS